MRISKKLVHSFLTLFHKTWKNFTFKNKLYTLSALGILWLSQLCVGVRSAVCWLLLEQNIYNS